MFVRPARLRGKAIPRDGPGLEHGVDDSCVLTVRVGVATYQPRCGIPAQELLRQADQALYEAKRRGRNATVAYGISEGVPI